MNELEAVEKVRELVKMAESYTERSSFEVVAKRIGYTEEWPNFYPGYNAAMRDYMDIKVHSERSYFPERLFREKSPNISEVEYNYLQANYKNTTVPIFLDFVNSVARAFSKGNWALTYNEPKATFKNDSFENYVSEEKEYIEWFKNVLPTIKLKDANGVLGVLPKYQINYNPETDTQTIDESILPEVDVRYYATPQVWFNTGKEIICLEEEKSLVLYGATKKEIGRIFTFYTTEHIYTIEQVGKYTDHEFAVVGIIEHALEYCPAFRLGGVPMLVDSTLIYQSPFAFAVDNLDLALINENNLQTSLQLTMYPYRVMIGDECDFEDSNGNHCFKGNVDNHQCPECHGSGMKNRPSRMGTLLVNNKELSGDNVKPSESMVFVQPSTEGLRFVSEIIEKNEKKARAILHLYDTNSQPTGKEDTATAAKIDQESQYAFIKSVSDGIFRLMYNILHTVGQMRYGKDFEEFSLTEPVNFDFRGREDYAKAIEQAQKLGVPMLIEQAIYEAIEHYFHTNEHSQRIYELLLAVDRLFVYTPEMIEKALLNKTASRLEVIIHYRYLQIAEILMSENPQWGEKDKSEQVADITAKAQIMLDEIDAATGSGNEDLIGSLLRVPTPITE